MSDLDERARIRRIERHGAAVIRAVSRQPEAEFRAQRLRLDHHAVPFAAPWLVADPSSGSIARNRGVADALGLRLRHSDFDLHRELAPRTPFAAVVFDVLEQIRCEAIAMQTTAEVGIRRNLDAAFNEWTMQAESYEVGESSLGLLLYTLVHMARSALIRPVEDEIVQMTIEVTRSNISPVIGAPLYALRDAVHDQAAFAPHAQYLALLMDDIAGHPEDDKRSSTSVAHRTGLTIPAGWSEADGEGDIHGSRGAAQASWVRSADPQDLDTVGGYRVWTRDHDIETTGARLYPAAERLRMRANLDRQISAQAVSATRLAFQLQQLLGRPAIDGWTGLQEEGVLDPARLSQLVSAPSFRHVFRTDRIRPVSPAVVTFLVDQSGSMKRQRYETVAVLVDTFCRALDLAGAQSEVLGFSTADWNGGRALREWHAAGSPEEPGRLAETMHIVYKTADQPWRRARSGIAAMMDSRHFREGVDGEALAWAYRRLLLRPEPRKLLVFISDGSPFEAATANNNRPGFLDEHIVAVAEQISADPRVELGSIGVDLDMAPYMPNSLTVDLTGTLTLGNYQALHTLFA